MGPPGTLWLQLSGIHCFVTPDKQHPPIPGRPQDQAVSQSSREPRLYGGREAPIRAKRQGGLMMPYDMFFSI